MLHEQSQIGLKGRQRLYPVRRRSSGSSQTNDPLFLFRDDPLCVPYATLGQCEGIVVDHKAVGFSDLVRQASFVVKRAVK
jgi:hypothetical protein